LIGNACAPPQLFQFADECGVAGFLDGEGDDAAFVLFEGADELLEAADLILEKNGELPDAGGLKTRAGLRLWGKDIFHVMVRISEKWAGWVGKRGWITD